MKFLIEAAPETVRGVSYYCFFSPLLQTNTLPHACYTVIYNLSNYFQLNVEARSIFVVAHSAQLSPNRWRSLHGSISIYSVS